MFLIPVPYSIQGLIFCCHERSRSLWDISLLEGFSRYTSHGEHTSIYRCILTLQSDVPWYGVVFVHSPEVSGSYDDWSRPGVYVAGGSW